MLLLIAMTLALQDKIYRFLGYSIDFVVSYAYNRHVLKRKQENDTGF